MAAVGDISWPAPNVELRDGWLMSPTFANRLAACGFRAAWSLDPDPLIRRLPRPNTHSALGTVAHEVREAVLQGLLRGCQSPEETKEVLRERWDHEVAKASAKLDAAWSPAVPPQPGEWPGHQLVLARTIVWANRRAERITGSASGSPPDSVERELVDESSLIKGTPDLVEVHGDTCVVVDLKTGLAQDGIKEDQRRQLLMYAHLVAATSAVRPSSIAIENPAGRRWEEAIGEEDWSAAITDVLDRRRDFESALAAGSIEDLAQPDAETCRFCPFRPVCGPYWRAVTSDWHHRSVAGRLLSLTQVQGGFDLEIDVLHPIDAEGPFLIGGVPSEGPPEGSSPAAVAVVGAEWNGAPTNLRGTWSTLAWWHEA